MKRRDKPTFNEPTRHVGLQLETGLYEAVKQLALSTGVSMNYAIRRALIDMVNVGVVPIAEVLQAEEEAETAEQPLPAPINAQRLRELEKDFERIQNELESIKRGSVEIHRTVGARTAMYDGSRPVGRPRIAQRGPVSRAR